MKTLAVYCEDDHIITELFDEDHQIQFIGVSEKNDMEAHAGDIYLARVKNIVKNINAAFVEYENGKNGYLSLDEKADPVIIHNAGQHIDRTEKKLVQGDEIIVQVKKEASKTKPPTFTSKIEYAGEYAVVSFGRPGIGVSGKIKDREKRKEIRETLEKVLDTSEMTDIALIARTNAANITGDRLYAEALSCISCFTGFIKRSYFLACPCVLRKETPEYIRAAADIGGIEELRITTNDPDIFNDINEYFNGHDMPNGGNSVTDILKTTERYSIELRDRKYGDEYPNGSGILEAGRSLKDDKSNFKDCMIELWNSDERGNMDTVFRIKKHIRDALKEKVWLRSGGFLIIQVTEALTVVDVNSGSDVKKAGKVQETFKRINLEAAGEIMRQLKLRNLSGIIIVDLIDMDDETDKNDVLHHMRELASFDPVGCSVIDMTRLGLVEITRKKKRKPLYEQVKECRDNIKI